MDVDDDDDFKSIDLGEIVDFGLCKKKAKTR